MPPFAVCPHFHHLLSMIDMPFGEKSLDERRNSYYIDENARADILGIDDSTFSNSVQFQIPKFMLNGPPTLAPGGGAEVLPAGMFNPGASWFTNNGFNTKFPENV